MDGNELKKWVIHNHIIRKTTEGFWRCFKNYMDENKGEFEEFFGEYKDEKIKLWFKEVRLTIRNWDEEDVEYWTRLTDEYNCNLEFIDALIIVGYDEEEGIAEYTMRFKKDGESFDDFFKTDWKDWTIDIE